LTVPVRLALHARLGSSRIWTDDTLAINKALYRRYLRAKKRKAQRKLATFLLSYQLS